MTRQNERHNLVTALEILVLIVVGAIILGSLVSCGTADYECRKAGGRVVVHTWSGRDVCDMPPHSDSLGDEDLFMPNQTQPLELVCG